MAKKVPVVVVVPGIALNSVATGVYLVFNTEYVASPFDASDPAAIPLTIFSGINRIASRPKLDAAAVSAAGFQALSTSVVISVAFICS